MIARRKTNFGASDQFIDIYDASGALIQSFQGFDEGVWLDDQQIVLTTWQRGPQNTIEYPNLGLPSAASYLAGLGSADIAPLSVSLAYARSNGHGALSVDRCLICAKGVGYYRDAGYSVWTPDGGLTKPKPGLLEAWSQNGDRALIDHLLANGPASPHWYEIITWPVFVPVARGGGTLNADFTWSARWKSSDDTTNGQLMNLASGTVTTFTFASSGGEGAWNAAGQLVLADYATGDATGIAPDGAVSGHWTQLGPRISPSADHSVLAFYDDSGASPSTINLLSSNQVHSVEFPGQIATGFSGIWLSPTGSEMVVVGVGGSGQTAYLDADGIPSLRKSIANLRGCALELHCL